MTTRARVAAPQRARWLCAWLLAMAWGPANAVQAQSGANAPAAHGSLETAPSVGELSALAGELTAAEAARRERAFHGLRTLGSDALPATAKRLDAIAARGFDAGLTLTAMSELRRVQGDQAPEAELDLALGALPLLAKQRTTHAALAVELVALLRALESQKSVEAAELIVSKLFALDSKLFRYEAPRTRARLGVLLLPAFIRHQTHPRSWVRSFCQESLVAMRMDKPGRAVQQDDVSLLSAILLAYGATLNFEAMPVVVSYVTDERIEVRDAARSAVARFGKNAIWQLRERYLNATGKEADASWGHQRLLAELTKLFEDPKRAAMEQALAAAHTALEHGEHQAAHAALDRALLVDPAGESAQAAAPLYAQLAAHYEEAGQLELALAGYRRALRLAPDNARLLEARVTYLQAELKLARGQVELSAYRRALALDPSLDVARETLDELTGERSRRDRQRRQVVGLSASALLVLAALLVLRGARKPRDAEEPSEPSADDAASESSQPST